LGSIASNFVGIISYGFCLTNDTAASASNFVITYTGEQWRNGDTADTNTLTFWYRVSPFALTNPEPGVVTNWTHVDESGFRQPDRSDEWHAAQWQPGGQPANFFHRARFGTRRATWAECVFSLARAAILRTHPAAPG